MLTLTQAPTSEQVARVASASLHSCSRVVEAVRAALEECVVQDGETTVSADDAGYCLRIRCFCYAREKSCPFAYVQARVYYARVSFLARMAEVSFQDELGLPDFWHNMEFVEDLLLEKQAHYYGFGRDCGSPPDTYGELPGGVGLSRTIPISPPREAAEAPMGPPPLQRQNATHGPWSRGKSPRPPKPTLKRQGAV